MRAPAGAWPAGGRAADGAGKPDRAVTGRSSSTLSLSIMVALARALWDFQAGPP